MNQKNGFINWLTTKWSGAKTPSLGTRELAILEVLWQHRAQPAQDVLEHLSDKSIGLNTVQSTLERLYRKNLASRTKVGRAYVYAASITRHDLIRSLLHDITRELAGGDPAPMVSGFIDYLEDKAPEIKSTLDAAQPPRDGDVNDS